jgi:tyrosyl-tRNA synthetase
MIRKTHGLETDACCFSIPLLLKPDGTKFGKSESGAVYLDANVTSPYVMYQFLINQPDSMIEDMLKRFTFLSKEEIEKTMKEHKEDVSKRIAQKKLGKELLIDIHSKEAYEKSLKISEALFSNKLDTLEKNDLFEALVGTNNITNINEKEINIVDLLIVANVVKSKTEARKLVEQKGIYVNNVLIDNSSIIINSKNSIDNKFSYIKKGKKDYYLII